MTIIPPRDVGNLHIIILLNKGGVIFIYKIRHHIDRLQHNTMQKQISANCSSGIRRCSCSKVLVKENSPKARP